MVAFDDGSFYMLSEALDEIGHGQLNSAAQSQIAVSSLGSTLVIVQGYLNQNQELNIQGVICSLLLY